MIAKSEGDKRSVELSADAELYRATNEAEAKRVNADATAYAIEVEAKANAEQTRLISLVIADNGQPAINFVIMKRQVQALGDVASGPNTKTVIILTDMTRAIRILKTVFEQFKKA